jgi:DNA-binding MarR family transcriptional regulator
MSSISEIAEEIAMISPRIARRFFLDISEVADISHSQLFVIMRLANQGAACLSEISQDLKVSAPTATGLIDRLEKTGFVQRTPDKEDRRSVVVDLTPEGKKLAQKLRAGIIKRWMEILSKLSREDAEKYLEILKKIREAL